MAIGGYGEAVGLAAAEIGVGRAERRCRGR